MREGFREKLVLEKARLPRVTPQFCKFSEFWLANIFTQISWLSLLLWGYSCRSRSVFSFFRRSPGMRRFLSLWLVVLLSLSIYAFVWRRSNKLQGTKISSHQYPQQIWEWFHQGRGRYNGQLVLVDRTQLYGHCEYLRFSEEWSSQFNFNVMDFAQSIARENTIWNNAANV